MVSSYLDGNMPFSMRLRLTWVGTRRAAKQVVLACLFCSPVVMRAQAGSNTIAKDLDALPLTRLSYSDPQVFPIGNRNMGLLADMRCGTDETVFLEALDPSEMQEGGGIFALRPDGNVARFEHIPSGLKNLSVPLSFFVNDERLYTLQEAERPNPDDPAKVPDKVYVVQIYGLSGTWENSLVLQPGMNPISIAAFNSGKILISSFDPLNEEMALHTLDSNGRALSTLRLFDHDYTKQATPGTSAFTPEPDGYREKLLGSLKFYPRGENLLIVPVGTKLPLLEISDSAVLRPISLALPPGTVEDNLQSSEGRTLYMRVAHVTGDPLAAPENIAFRGDAAVFVFDASDGAIFRKVEVPEQLSPVCIRDGQYIFFEPRKEDARYEVVRATERQ
jgi:hypothetical protein